VNRSSVVQKGGNELKERSVVAIRISLVACKPWHNSGVGQVKAVCILPWESKSLWYGVRVGENKVLVLPLLWPSTGPTAAACCHQG